MSKRILGWTLGMGLVLVLSVPAFAQQSRYPLMEKIAQNVILRYQNVSCQELVQQKMQKVTPEQAQLKQRVVALLRNDPQMRKEFFHRVSGTIVNKMFECGFIP